jgi:hypothetical protein
VADRQWPQIFSQEGKQVSGLAAAKHQEADILMWEYYRHRQAGERQTGLVGMQTW